MAGVSSRRPASGSSRPALPQSDPPAASPLDRLLEHLDLGMQAAVTALTAPTSTEQIARAGLSLVVDGPCEPLSPTELALAVGVIIGGGDLPLAAVMTGRSLKGLRQMVKADPVLAEQFDQAREVRHDFVKRGLFVNGQIPGRDGVADRIFYLKNFCGFADRTSITGHVDVGVYPKLVERSMRPEIEAEARRELGAVQEPGT